MVAFLMTAFVNVSWSSLSAFIAFVFRLIYRLPVISASCLIRSLVYILCVLCYDLDS